MTQIPVAIGQKYKRKDAVFEIKRFLEDGNVIRVQDVNYNTIQDIRLEDFLEAYENREIRFPDTGKNVVTVDGFGEYNLPDYDGLSDAQKAKYEFKKFAIAPLIGLRGKERSEAVNKRVQELSALDVRSTSMELIKYVKENGSPVRQTLYKWIDEIEKSQGDLRALIPDYHHSGPGSAKRLEPRVESIMEDVIQRFEKSGEHITTATVHAKLYQRIHEHNILDPSDKLDCPSESTVYRRLQERNPEEVYQNKFGSQAAYDKYGNVGTKERGKKPMELLEADHLTLDLIVVDEATREVLRRVYLTVLMDTNTNYICGYHLSYSQPNAASVLYALEHAIRTKDYVKEKYPRVKGTWHFTGAPMVILTDRGKDFMSKHVEETCDRIGITLRHCEGRHPWHKGQIERLFRTINMQIHQMPGTTYSNSVERKKRNYDSEKNAVIPVSTLHEIIHIWIIDIYHKQRNRGVRGVPENVFLERTKLEPVHLPKAPDWTDRIGLVKEGAIQDSGIRFQYLDYNSTELHQLWMHLLTKGKSTRVKFLRDPSDVGFIRVCDAENDRYFKVPCRDLDYAAGLSEFAHRLIITKMNEDHRANSHDRLLQKALLFDIPNEEVPKTKRARTDRARMTDKGLDEAYGVEREAPQAREESKLASKHNRKVVELHRIDMYSNDDWGGRLVRKNK